MMGNDDVGISYRLSEPINRRIEEINKIFFDNEIFDKAYNKFLLEQNRLGQKVTFLNFIESILIEIQEIWDGALGTEYNYKQEGIEIKLHSVFSQLIDVRKNAEKRIIEIEQHIKKNESFKTNDTLPFNSYQTKNLIEILNRVHKDRFIEIEKELFERKFLNEKCHWNGKPVDLAVFVEFLIREKYFKPFTGKSERTKRNIIRRFFEERYDKQFSDQFKPSNLTYEVYNTHSIAFTFIRAIFD